MKKFANIFFLATLLVLPSVVQSDYSVIDEHRFEVAQVAQHQEGTNVPHDGIYNPLLLFRAEANISLSSNIPKPEVSEKLHDQLSRDASNKTSYPDNTALFLASSRHIDVGLSIKKLIFPFHSFL